MLGRDLGVSEGNDCSREQNPPYFRGILCLDKRVHPTARYPIKSLGVFSSYVWSDYTKKSDLDLLVEFDESAHFTLFGYAHIENELSDLLGVKVDLIQKRLVKPRILENILKEVVYV